MDRLILKSLFAVSIVLAVAGFGEASASPVITGFNPAVGAPGDQIQLTGSGFLSGGLTVRFWNGLMGPVASIVYLNSDTLMTVAVPSGLITGPISIQQGANSPFYTESNFLAVGFGPYISDFSPLYAAVNTTVVINGVHLTNTLAVLFNGTNATEFTPNASGTQITTRVPAGATSGLITVSTLYGTSNSPTAFTVVGPGPYIADFSPISGDGGTTVTIDGLHFTGVTGVTFNGQRGGIVSATSDTAIQVQVPAGVTSGPIAVSTPSGSFVTSSNFFGKPAIAAVSPPYGRANTNVLITGTNFLGASAVSFNALPAANFTVLNNSNLSATVPVGATTGLIRVVVPGASAFSSSNFAIPPTLSGFSPAFGPVGTLVTITGANLNGANPAVRFNGVAAAAPTGVTFGQLTAKVPAGASTGPISVTTVDGSDTNSSLFYLPAVITNFTPTNSGPGSTILITGQNFTGTSGVSFNGTPAAGFSVSNNAAMSATVPSNLITGPISITTPANTVSSSGAFFGAPAITNFTPTHGLPGASVTIQGVNFLGGSVLFSGVNASILSLNNTQIVATVPAAAQTGPITVRGPAGTNTSAGKFTLDYNSNLQVWFTNSSKTATLGSNFTYAISLVNAGPNSAPNATFTNILPTIASLVSASIPPPWVLATNGNLLTGTITNFGSGSATTLNITVVPQVTGTMTDTISITSDNPDPVPGDNVASFTTIIEPPALLSIQLLADQVTVSWRLSLSNYVLQFQDALGTNPPWLNVSNPPTIAGGYQSVTQTNNGSGRFYRLKR
jgi:uncharacterized repeat protein (TIGR01451 family)